MAGPSERSTTERVDRVLAEFLERDEAPSDESVLADLGIDSLGTLSLLMCLEDEFGVLIPVERLAEAGCRQTVRDIRVITAEAVSDDDVPSGGQ